MRLLRGFTVLAVVGSLLAAPVAHADPDPPGPSDTMTVGGTGTITPGIPCPPAGCSITWTYTATVSGDEVVTATGCVANGIINAGALIGIWSGHADLSGCGGLITGSVDYTVTGLLVTLKGTVTVNGDVHTVGPGTGLVAILTSTPPSTSFALSGTVELDD